MIRTSELTIGYTHQLLTVDNVQLNTSELYFLIGKNGSGKSTFFKTITGSTPCLSGKVLLNKQNVSSIPLATLPTVVAFVGPHFPSVDFLTVEQYVGLARTPYTNQFGRLKDEDHKIIQDSLSIIDIVHLKERFVTELSDGEKQMVAIAKALAQQTDIIILDEPTAFLDYSNKTIVLNILQQISIEMNKCIIISTHDIDMSIELGCSYLVVNKNKKRIQLVNSPVKKEVLLALAF